MSTDPATPDLETIRAKASVSIHLVRSLVDSWLPPLSKQDQQKEDLAFTKSNAPPPQLYSSNRESAKLSRRNEAIKRAIAGSKKGEGEVSVGGVSKSTKDSDSDDEPVKGASVKLKKGTHITTGNGSGAVGNGDDRNKRKKPVDALSLYLNRDKGNNKHKKKKIKIGM